MQRLGVLPLVAVIALGAVATSRAERAGSVLPSGWRTEGNQLVWTSEVPLRMGGARYEFRSGDRLLGYPRQHGDILRLRISPTEPLAQLSVWAAGRRLDAAAPQLRVRPQAIPDEAPLAVAVADPAARGPYRTRRLRYELTPLPIEEYEFPVEVVAEVTAPLGTRWPAPMVLFLHGRHSTCYRGGPQGQASGDWPCPQGWRPVPSHAGYRYITDILASQGYITVSISANGVNGQDSFGLDGGAAARSRLIRHHLASWARWAFVGGDPWGGLFRGRVLMNRVVLVGHSRGGEGVERATIDSRERDPWTIRGLVLIGPTAFGRQVAPGVHTTVILPFCDGDVSDLQGQQYVDIGRDLTSDPALRSSVMAMGTNHNYYNTEWTPGLSKSPAWDDWFDSGDVQCGETRSRRLTPTEQQAVGLAYTAALVNLAIASDASSLPLLDGTRVKPPSIGRATASVHAIGGNKKVLYAGGSATAVSAKGLSAGTCRGYRNVGPFDLRPGCTPNLYFELIPHWIPMSFAETAPAPRALKVEWTSPDGRLRIPIAGDMGRAEALDFRLAGEPGEPPVQLDVRIRDAAGAWITLAKPPPLNSYYGPSPLGKVVARQIRASLRGANVAARGISAVELVPRTPRGRFWLLDVSAYGSALAPSRRIHLPQVGVGDVIVEEGDSGEYELQVPLTIDGVVREPASLWVQLTNYSTFEDPVKGFPLVLAPGATSATFPFKYRADDVFNPYPQLTQVALLAQANAVTGDLEGSVLVEDDDPAPRLRVDARRVTAAEGAPLTWTFRLSRPMGDWAFWSIELRPPGARFPELDTDDVTQEFLDSYGISPRPDPAVPLSQLGIFFGVEFEPGAQAATVTIPIAQDGDAEPDEGVVLFLDGFGDPVVPRPIEVTGFVPAGG